jgi:hypothetical protein
VEDEAASARPRARALDTIVVGGLAIAVLDFIDASTFFPLYYGITFQQVWWGPASGIVGRDAVRAGGWNTALLGILMHFIVAFCIAAVYFLLTRVIPLVLRHPIIAGLVFGVLAHYVMQMVVVPLSARGGAPMNVFNETFGAMLNSLIGHALLVGLPVALIAAWSSKRDRTA